MQGHGSKDELRKQVAQVTLDSTNLQDKVEELRHVFVDLENLHAEAAGCCFPFKYIMLRDMVQEVSELATDLEQKWYGSTDQANAKRPRGVINRLIENCRAFSANRQALSRYEVILEGLSGLKYKELEQTLEERRSALSQQKVVFNQLRDLLRQLKDLHTESQQMWLCPRYIMLQSGVNSALAAFNSVVGLAQSSS